MPYCAVYNCSTSSKVDKNVSFFRFPKDAGLQKAWVHYCRRRDLTLTKCSKICEKHFTPDQYSRYPPRLAELGYPNARAQLKDDAVPDVEWPTQGECSTSSNTEKKPSGYGAYRKRQILQVLKEAMIESDDTDLSDHNVAEESVNVDADVSETQAVTPSSLSNVSAEFEPSTVDKAIQVFIPDNKVKTKTRRIQTGKSKIGFKTVDTEVQCSEIQYCVKCGHTGLEDNTNNAESQNYRV
ncbi:52 kDa repressor of the inhibitor of the protein kinase-like [Ostrea edulis]|uniref:52 kDa repressor of the inhibitor of the protein kinase-like n=1 Tax=Ostrea edulis TaxID=37623 RepID=UPI0024AF53AD|nr:52 kDa repressor of the inhibitor of the protein kinase-like [Ostrea edulis]